MVKNKVILSVIILFACSTSGEKYPWFQGNLDLAKSVAGSRLIMLDFYADW